MAGDKKFYWIKLKDTFMTSDTVDFLMSQKSGANYVVLYQMLCLKTINTNGELARKIGEIIIPYDADKIQRDCKYFDIDTIRVALELYKQLGLIYKQEDSILKIANFENMVGSETAWAEKKRITRNNGLPQLKNGVRRLNREMIALPNGETKFIDEKRYGGNGAFCYDLAGCKCEICGSQENLVIHHGNSFSNDIDDLYLLCRRCHGLVEAGSIKLSHSEGRKMSTLSSTVLSTQEKEIRDKILDKDIKKKDTLCVSQKEKAIRFIPPTQKEVEDYCLERKNKVDAERFINFYTSKDWYIGKNKMKDWKASIRTWESKEKAELKKKQGDFLRHDYTDEQSESVLVNFED